MVNGKGYNIDEKSRITHEYNVQHVDHYKLFEDCYICQPAAFLRKDVFQKMGGVDESLHFCMDYDLWIRISKEYHMGYIDDYLANSRLHAQCKSVDKFASVGMPEILKTSQKHYGAVSNHWLHIFIMQFQEFGIYWLLERLKEIEAFGKSPRIVEMNRDADLWVPPHFTVKLKVDSGKPVQTLLITGRNSIANDVPSYQPFHYSLLVNGRYVGYYSLDKDRRNDLLFDKRINRNFLIHAHPTRFPNYNFEQEVLLSFDTFG